jgi:hypothetical protein
MKNVKIKKSLLFLTAFAGIFILFLSGFAAYYSSPAYSEGYYGVGVATPNFAFSFGNGVNAYEAPIYGGYIYGYNGYYYRWLNGGWVYANVYAGPWYPVTSGIYMPGILAFGPPPPVVAYPGYFSWWRNNIGPWYRDNHPGWWGRHHMFLENYGTWRSHVNNYYNNRPYQNWRMRRPFEHGGPAFRGQGPRGPMQQQGPAFRGQGPRGPMQQQGQGFRGQGPRGPMQQQGPAFRGQGPRGPAQQARHGGPNHKGRDHNGNGR